MTPSTFSFMLRWFAPTFLCGVVLVALGLYGSIGLPPDVPGNATAGIKSGVSTFGPYLYAVSLTIGMILIVLSYSKANDLRSGLDTGLLKALFPPKTKNSDVSQKKGREVSDRSSAGWWYLSVMLAFLAPAITWYFSRDVLSAVTACIGCLCGWSFAKFMRAALDESYDPDSNFIFFLLPPVVFVVGVFNTTASIITFSLVMGFFFASTVAWRKAIH